MIGNVETAETATLTCPTCGAQQAWSDCCRRCKSDLTELRAVWRAWRRAHAQCLTQLAAGDFAAARRAADTMLRLHPDPSARRLAAVCAALLGDWESAWRWTATSDDAQRPARSGSLDS